jgi:hypothetical protein
LDDGKLTLFSFALQTPQFTCKMTKKRVKIGFISGLSRAQKIFSIVARYYRDIYDNIATFSKFRKPREIFADIIAKLNFADNIVNRAMLVTEV